jgi:hypothetical protein
MDPPVKNYILCGLKVEKDPFTGEINILTGTVKETPSCNTSPSVAPAGAGAGAGVSAGVATPPTTGTTLGTDARFTQYAKFKKLGMPLEAVKAKAKANNIHETYIELLFKDLNTPAPPEGTDLKLPPVDGASASASASASTSEGPPIPNDKIEPITTLFNTPEQIKHFQDKISSLTSTYIDTKYRILKKLLTEVQVEMNKTPRPSNYKEVQKMIDDNIKKIIQPSLDILNNFSTGTTLSSSDISNAQNNIKNIENLKGFLSSFISQTFNKELNTEINRVKKLFPSAKPLGDITTEEDFNKALRDNDPRFYTKSPVGIITGVDMNEIKNTYKKIYKVELDKTKLDKLLDDAKLKRVQKRVFIFSGGRRNMRRSTRKLRSNNRNTRRSKH